VGLVFDCASNWFNACLVAYVTTGACPCISFFGNLSMTILMEASEAKEMQQNPFDWPLALFS
jgi:hypothetical protein